VTVGRNKLLAFAAIAAMMAAAFVIGAASMEEHNEMAAADQQYDVSSVTSDVYVGEDVYDVTLGADQSYNSSSVPSVIYMTPGDRLSIRLDTFTSIGEAISVSGIPWLNKMDGPTNQYGYAEVGTWNGTASAGSFGFGTDRYFTVHVTYEITYRIGGYADALYKYPSNIIDLYSPEPRATEVIRWYTSSDYSGNPFGTAGNTVTISSNMILYGRWEQTTVILPAKTADTYVHYRGTVSYTIQGMIPPTATVTATWIQQNDPQTFPKITVTGNVITIPYVELTGAIYPVAIVASAPGMSNASMILNVHVYAHYEDAYAPHGLSFWSVEVNTNGKTADRLDVISAIRTDEVTGITEPVVGTVSFDAVLKKIQYTFTAEGMYEFTVGVTTKDGDQTTRVLKVRVTNTVISGTPWADGFDTFLAPDGLSFYGILINPVNFVEIRWDFGDNTILQNTSASVYHQYPSPNSYVVSAELINSLGESYTLLSTVDAIQYMVPPLAFLNTEYVAIVPVNASSASAVTVTLNGVPVTGTDWINWEFKTTANGNVVRIAGKFTDPTWVNRMDVIEVIESPGPNTNEPWIVTFTGVKANIVPDFLVQINGLDARIKYTGTFDAATDISVQWATGSPGSLGYESYKPTADGWMYNRYTSEGQYIISVSAIRVIGGQVEGTEYIASKVVLALAGGTGLPSLGGSWSNPGGNGSWSMEEEEDAGPNYIVYAVIAVTAIIAGLAFFTGRWYIGLPAAVIAIIVAIWEWIL